MNSARPPFNRISQWYEQHTKDALTISQPKFWFIFWVSFCCSGVAAYVICVYQANQWSDIIQYLALTGCLLFPFLTLRRLHQQALLVILLSLYGLAHLV